MTAKETVQNMLDVKGAIKQVQAKMNFNVQLNNKDGDEGFEYWNEVMKELLIVANQLKELDNAETAQEPKEFKDILESKINYYGETKFAYQSACNEYIRIKLLSEKQNIDWDNIEVKIQEIVHEHCNGYSTVDFIMKYLKLTFK